MSDVLFLAQQSGTSAGGGLLAGGLFIVFILLAIFLSVFWLWMLIDCLTSSLPSTEKLIWTLVILFTHIVGALIYFFVGRKGRGSVTS